MRDGLVHFLKKIFKRLFSNLFPINKEFLSNVNFTRNDKIIFTKYRSSRPEVFCEEGVLRNFAKFKGTHLCQKLFFPEISRKLATDMKKF